MADNTEKGPDTLRPPQGEDGDLYSSSTVVRDAPSELVEMIRQREELKAPALPKDLTSTKPPAAPKPPPPRPAAPAAPKAQPASGKAKVDDLWDALPSAEADDDDEGDDGMGSARGHAAEDVTRMLALPDELGGAPEPPKALSAEEAKRVAEAPPKIVVDDAPNGQATTSSHPPASAKGEQDEVIETSPRRNLASLRGGISAQNRGLWIACAVAAAVLLILLVSLLK